MEDWLYVLKRESEKRRGWGEGGVGGARRGRVGGARRGWIST